MANADDGTLGLRLRRLLFGCGLIPEANGFPQVGADLSEVAAGLLPDLRALLADGIKAKRIIEVHRLHVSSAIGDNWDLEAVPERERWSKNEFVVVQADPETGWRKCVLRSKFRNVKTQRGRGIVTVRDPLDPVCIAIEAAMNRQRALPVRRCACGKFFLRALRSRRIHCKDCARTAWRLSREEMREYQRARRLKLKGKFAPNLPRTNEKRLRAKATKDNAKKRKAIDVNES